MTGMGDDRSHHPVLAAMLGSALLFSSAGLVQAQQPTREEIIESLRARQNTRCPNFDAKVGCVVPADRIDVEVHFGLGSAGLDAVAVSQLAALSPTLGNPEHRGAPLVVAGYTDARGGDEYNQRLSERRAAAVKRFLIARFKLREDAITTIGHGKTQPKNAADPFASENRRVEIRDKAAGAVEQR
jgi:outer membrane protein OmpA-like peptidoglycan-associated protein